MLSTQSINPPLTEAIILAGGMGTRLRSVVADVPKPLAPIADRPFLDWLLQDLIRLGFTRVILATGFGSEAIEARYGTHWKTLEIVISRESLPLGTGGAIRLASNATRQSQIAVLNGDTYATWSPDQVYAVHTKMKAAITVVLKSLQRVERYGTVTLTGDRISAFHEKRFVQNGTINAGIYLVDQQKVNWNAFESAFSFEKAVLEKQINNLVIAGSVAAGPFIDIGIPEDFALAQHLIPEWLR